METILYIYEKYLTVQTMKISFFPQIVFMK